MAETSTTLHGITIYMGLVSQPNIYSLELQQGTNIQERLLNKPYVNDVTLRGQKLPFWHTFTKDLDLLVLKNWSL